MRDRSALKLRFLLLFFITSYQVSLWAQSELLELSLEELINIEVTSAARKVQQLSDVAAAVYVITAEDLRRSGVTSIPEALRVVPGLHVARIDDNKWAVSARGFNDLWGNKLLVLMDGRQIYTPYYAGVMWDDQSIPIDNVERIEVIRGPGATLWGSNAVNGIINIISRRPRDTQGLLMSARSDSDDSHRLTLRYGGATENSWHYRFDVDSIEENATTSPLSNNDFNTWERFRTSFRLDGSPIKGHELHLEGAYFKGESKETIRPLFHNHHQDILDLRITQEVIDTEGGWLMADWQKHDEDGAGWSIKAYIDKSQRDVVLYETDQLTYSLEFEQRFLLGEHHDLVWGMGTRKSTLPLSLNSDNFDVLDRNDEFKLFEAYVQDEIALRSNLKLVLGTKFEHSEYAQTEIQPSVRLSWQLDNGLALWGSVSRAMRTPSRRETGMRIFPSEVFSPHGERNSLPIPLHVAITGSGNLNSEELIAYEFGLRSQINNRFDIDLALFENHYDDLIEATDVNFTCAPYGEDIAIDPDCLLTADHRVRQMQLQNGPIARSTGAELALNAQMSEVWRLRAGLTSINIETSGVDEEFLLVTKGPKWLANLRSEWQISDNLELDVTFRAVDESPRFQIDSYTTADLRLGWRVNPEFMLEVIGHNLLDRGHREFGSSLLETEPSYIGRSIAARFTWAP
ncbi:MAG: TonB-dependent receptor [Pseudomonadales bacterium]|nr:TonB-dependent receptor [Pseudomonadales bacterium]